jgi:glycosyltransferase involved in cell wall biosynthesis
MNLYLDGSWLAEGIGLTGTRRFSAELNAAVLGRLAGAGASVTGHVFSIGQRVESHFRRPDARYVVVPTGYRFLLYANALLGLPDLRRALDPPPDAIHLHDPIRFAGSGSGRPRTLVTVHDLAALREPATYPARAVWLRRRSLRRLRRSAAIVHAVSEATRADLVELGGIPGDRVHVVPEGVHPAFFTAVPRTVRAAALARLGIDRPFLLHVGSQHRRKNLPFLVRCFRTVVERLGHDILLVLAGPGAAARVDEWCRDAGYDAAARTQVRHLGPIHDGDLRVCLQSCAALVFPSLYEGFGLPVLEAMASGAPVIASDRASLPEVVGQAGLLVDPEDEEAWIEAMAALLSAPTTAAALAACGRVRAASFTWDLAATRLLALLGITLS